MLTTASNECNNGCITDCHGWILTIGSPINYQIKIEKQSHLKDTLELELWALDLDMGLTID